ncbi:DUF3565 domain-containing protein [Pseudomonas sp.]|uniref:DUF3565 domain-containing protein n=1 Tax=Pseudomonas sp. TaxID=306 RepID=UPI003A9877CA
MDTALLAAISMGRDLLLMNKERTSLTKASPESEPGPDGRTGSIPVYLLDFRQDEDGHWVAILSCGHTQHLRHEPPWQNRQWVQSPELRRAQLGQPFDCGWCAAAATPPKPDTETP